MFIKIHGILLDFQTNEFQQLTILSIIIISFTKKKNYHLVNTFVKNTFEIQISTNIKLFDLLKFVKKYFWLIILLLIYLCIS